MLTFVWMGISGVLISKTILTSISTTNGLMKLYHMCMGGLSVILLGIHIGLHICRKEMRTKVAVVLTSLAVAGGIYGISSSELVRWVGMPFRAATSSHLAVEREVPFGEHSGQGQGESNLIQKINVFIQFFGLIRNIHFYVNVCGFHITEFFNEKYPMPDPPEEFIGDGNEGMFEFRKQM